ncbi:hypothetical protein, partial [Salmonella enterica]
MLDSAATLAPDWLVVPEDPNDLAPGVWPSSATRDEDGGLVLAGVPAPELARTYGTPLLVLDEDEVRRRARAFRDAFDRAASTHGTTAQVYYAGKAFLCTTVARWVVDE